MTIKSGKTGRGGFYEKEENNVNAHYQLDFARFVLDGNDSL